MSLILFVLHDAIDKLQIWVALDVYYNVERNELYNAHGAVTDTPTILRLVSPCRIDEMNNWKEDGAIFAELGME